MLAFSYGRGCFCLPDICPPQKRGPLGKRCTSPADSVVLRTGYFLLYMKFGDQFPNHLGMNAQHGSVLISCPVRHMTHWKPSGALPWALFASPKIQIAMTIKHDLEAHSVIWIENICGPTTPSRDTNSWRTKASVALRYPSCTVMCSSYFEMSLCL